MVNLQEKQETTLPTKKLPHKWTIIGPGLIVAATGVGAGDLVAALVAGTNYGLVFIWSIIIGALLKFALNEGVGRWHLISGKTILEGWQAMGKWATGYFGVYVLIWGFVYGAAGTSSCALAMSAMFPAIPLWVWAIVHGVAGFALTWRGQFRLFERAMNILIIMMFITVVGSALFVLPALSDIWETAIPQLPEGSLLYALGLIGGVGGSITMASYGYWLQENRWKGKSYIPLMRYDSAIAYFVTAVFTLSLLVLGAALLFGTNYSINGEQGLVSFASVMGNELHPVMRWIFLLGFWSASFTSVLGVWNGVAYLFADFVHTIRPSEVPKEQLSQTKAFRFYVFWLTFPPMLLHFLGKPVGLIIVYGALGAVFMPFMALTLLWLLNSKKHSPLQDRNNWVSNVLLSLCVVLFFVLAATELSRLF